MSFFPKVPQRAQRKNSSEKNNPKSGISKIERRMLRRQGWLLKFLEIFPEVGASRVLNSEHTRQVQQQANIRHDIGRYVPSEK